jgi:hypothetical protein
VKVSGSILPVAEFTLLLIETIRRRAAQSALLRVDVDAHRSLRNRHNNKIAAISRLLRCLLSYLQPGNAWKQFAAADVAPI